MSGCTLPRFRFLSTALAWLALLGVFGCPESYRPPPTPYYTHEPILMTYAELRNSFAVQPPRDIVKNGKIMTFGTLLFITERFEGIHVLDNSDPSQPRRLHFLRIPGTVDMACKDGVLYADSTVDLLAIEITGSPIRVLKRSQDAFPWDPYQAVDDPNVTFPWDINSYQSQGVVIGAKPRR
jgi:hypothetical protein